MTGTLVGIIGGSLLLIAVAVWLYRDEKREGSYPAQFNGDGKPSVHGQYAPELDDDPDLGIPGPERRKRIAEQVDAYFEQGGSR